MYKIKRKCPFCGEITTIEVPFEQYMAWEMGELIQRAMPDVSPSDREVLISGICKKCQKEVFKG